MTEAEYQAAKRDYDQQIAKALVAVICILLMVRFIFGDLS